MVGNDDTVHSVLHREAGILVSDDALEQEPGGREVAEAVDKVPGQVSGPAGAGEAADVQAVEHGAFAGRVLEPRLVAGQALRIAVAPEPGDGFAVGGRHVHRHRDGRASGGLGTADQTLRDFPLLRRVKLVPDRGAALGVDVFDAKAAHSRHDLQTVPGPGGPRRGEFALGVKRLLGSAGCEDDRERVPGSEEFDFGIHHANVHQAANA